MAKGFLKRRFYPRKNAKVWNNLAIETAGTLTDTSPIENVKKNIKRIRPADGQSFETIDTLQNNFQKEDQDSYLFFQI